MMINDDEMMSRKRTIESDSMSPVNFQIGFAFGRELILCIKLNEGRPSM